MKSFTLKVPKDIGDELYSDLNPVVCNLLLLEAVKLSTLDNLGKDVIVKKSNEEDVDNEADVEDSETLFEEAVNGIVEIIEGDGKEVTTIGDLIKEDQEESVDTKDETEKENDLEDAEEEEDVALIEMIKEKLELAIAALTKHNNKDDLLIITNFLNEKEASGGIFDSTIRTGELILVNVK